MCRVLRLRSLRAFLVHLYLLCRYVRMLPSACCRAATQLLMHFHMHRVVAPVIFGLFCLPRLSRFLLVSCRLYIGSLTVTRPSPKKEASPNVLVYSSVLGKVVSASIPARARPRRLGHYYHLDRGLETGHVLQCSLDRFLPDSGTSTQRTPEPKTLSPKIQTAPIPKR